MPVSYRGCQISGNSGEYHVATSNGFSGPFQHYCECERFIDGLLSEGPLPTAEDEKTYTGFDHEDPAMAAWLRGEGENPFVKGDRS